MRCWRRWLRVAALSTAWCAAWAAVPATVAAASDIPVVRGSADARRMIHWVLASGDHRGLPFAVVDKRNARLYVLDGDGRLLGQTAALLGSTRGDHTVAGVGARAQSGEVAPDERTTPAGRFDSLPGRNLEGEHVVWADYASAFAIHRVRPGRAWKAREQRLATPSPADNRVSYGCVVVPVAFYEQVVERVLGHGRSVVYVLPETRPLHALFEALAPQH